MKESYCVVLTTTNCEENKQALVHGILSNHLAACIQTMPIESHYMWQGKSCNDVEILLVIKTTTDCYQELESLIVKIHNYEVPQVVQLPFSEGYNPYLAWLDENTRR